MEILTVRVREPYPQRGTICPEATHCLDCLCYVGVAALKAGELESILLLNSRVGGWSRMVAVLTGARQPRITTWRRYVGDAESQQSGGRRTRP
eukprot:5402808-Pyramimonas_sp.AAC.1